MSARKIRIGVMGAGECSAEIFSQAEEVGRMIAQQGAILICGGRGGVMEAAAKGAKAANGVTVGILPESDDGGANSYIDIPIVTGMGDGRNVINILSSQVIIAISGGYGTLSEIALALKSRTPVVALHSWNLSSPLKSFSTDPLFYSVTGVEEAVSQAIQLAKLSSPSSHSSGANLPRL
jgi:uncharacterized protein (TIGR00725 family)